MSTYPSLPADAPSAPSTPARTGPGRRVTDAPTRMLHWLFALCFVGAYLSGDSERLRALHVTLGYTMMGLLVARLLYGLIGPRTLRPALLWNKLKPAPRCLLELPLNLLRGQVNWQQLQNLATALLLLLVIPLTLSGYAVNAEWGGEWLEELHELVGNGTLALVFGHLGLLLTMSLLRGRNQAMPMLTGRIPGQGADLVRRNHLWLAALLLLTVLAYWGWEWQQAPNGLLSLQDLTTLTRADDGDDGDDD